MRRVNLVKEKITGGFLVEHKAGKLVFWQDVEKARQQLKKSIFKSASTQDVHKIIDEVLK